HQDVQDGGGEQRQPRDPQQLAGALEERRVGVHPRRPHELLQVARHVADDEHDEHEARHGHDDLLAYRRAVQRQRPHGSYGSTPPAADPGALTRSTRGGRFEFFGTLAHVRAPRAVMRRRASCSVARRPSSFYQSLIARIGSRTASALFSSAVRSSAVSSTSITCSRPFFPSLQGTPRNSPFIPYSPSSHAAHGRIRRWSFTIASAICTAPADGA